jgi:hypothetical protein
VTRKNGGLAFIEFILSYLSAPEFYVPELPKEEMPMQYHCQEKGKNKPANFFAPPSKLPSLR